jgi:alcohol dehydrogenase class IV
MSNTGIYTVHALAYPVGAFTRASHGACNGAILPAVLDFVAPVRHSEERRILQLMRSERSSAGDAVRDLLGEIGASRTLEELGLPSHLIERTAEIAFDIRRLMNGSPRSTSREQLVEIVRRAHQNGQ